MKNVLVIWNIALTLLIGYLFITKSTPENDTTSDSELVEIEPDTLSKSVNNRNVFYVNTDSLFNGFDMYKDMQEELVAEQLRMKKRYNGQLGKLESEYNDLREKAPYMTQTQGEAAQQKLMAKQQDLVKMEENLSAQLAKKEADMVKKIKTALTSYLEEIQEEKEFQFVLGKSEIGGVLYASEELDLTKEVLEGLNAKYKEANNTEK